eukprot:3200311-Ditylum_brightwellii.AAC.1
MESTIINKEGGNKDKNITNALEGNQSDSPSNMVLAKDQDSDKTDLGEFYWKQTLGHCTNEALAPTLKNTTQYFPHLIKAQNRAYPTQHHQQQLFP